MKRTPKQLCSTCKPSDLSYLEAHHDAQQRIKRGERQSRCPECGLWRWPHELPKREDA